MSKTVSQRLKIVTGLFLGVVCGVVIRSAFSKSSKTDQAVLQTGSPALAQNDWAPQQAAAQLVSAPPQKQAPPEIIAENTKTASAPDGKEEIPSDGKETIGSDGKETLPGEGKESLPPVGQFLPNSRPSAVDPSNGDPALEYLNNKNKNKNPTIQLLAPANPENIAGPVVSPETR